MSDYKTVVYAAELARLKAILGREPNVAEIEALLESLRKFYEMDSETNHSKRKVS